MKEQMNVNECKNILFNLNKWNEKENETKKKKETNGQIMKWMNEKMKWQNAQNGNYTWREILGTNKFNQAPSFPYVFNPFTDPWLISWNINVDILAFRIKDQRQIIQVINKLEMRIINNSCIKLHDRIYLSFN